MLLKLAQIDPNEICLVRERIYAHKQRLANAQNEQAAVAAASAAAAAAATTGSVLGLYNNSSSLTSQSFANEKNKKTAATNNNENKKKQAKINDILEESELFNTAMDANNNQKHNRRGVLVDEMMTIHRFPGDVRKLESCLSDVLFKDVWLNMAEILVESGFFQVARDYLFECLNASQVKENKQTFN